MLERLDSVLSTLSAKAKKDGAEAELLATAREGLSISTENQKLGKFTSNLSLAAGIRVIKNGAEGYCNTEDLSDQAIMSAYQEALENAQFNADNGVADPDLKMIGAQSGYRDIVRPDVEIDPMHIESKIKQAIELESACLAHDKRVSVVAYNGLGEQRAEVRVFNTNGVDRTYRDYHMSAYAYPLAKSGEESRMAGETFISRDPSEFKPGALAKLAAEKTLAKLGSAQPLTGRYPVLLEKEPAQSLIGMFLDYLSGKSIHDKLSVYQDALGKPVASPAFTLIDDPFLDAGLASQPFDSEGTPAQTLTLVENGILKTFLTNSIYARKLGMANTAHASRSPTGTLNISATNAVVKPGDKTREELIAQYDELIVITDITGLHAGFQHGSSDFSFQAEGEQWKGGKRVGPLSDFVLSGNLKDMMTKIIAVAAWPAGGPKVTDSVVTPELLISELSIAGRKE